MRCPIAFPIFFYLLAISLGLSLLTGSQVVHENPDNLIPSLIMPIDDQVSFYVDQMSMKMDSISSYMHANNYTMARIELVRFMRYSDNLKQLIRQINTSDQSYLEIENGLGSLQSDMGDILDYAEQYNISLQLYDMSLASGDSANASKYAADLRDSYAGIGTAYNRLYANSTTTTEALDTAGINSGRYIRAVDSLNEQINRLVDTYGEAVPGERSSSLWLSADLAPGDIVHFKAALSDGNRSPVSNALVDVFVNGSRIGTMTTGPNGNGSLDHAGPVDQTVANAIYMPGDGKTPTTHSNVVVLQSPAKGQALTLDIDRSEAHFGDPVSVFGDLKAKNGSSLSGRTVDILLNGQPAGSAVTDSDGRYSISIKIDQHFPAGPGIVQARYQDDHGNSYSNSKLLNISGMSAALTVRAPPAVNKTDTLQVNGSLVAANGIPVGGAKVSIYFDEAFLGISVTNSDGNYSLSTGIPENARAGEHAIRSAFEPGGGKALEAASSSITHISVAGDNGQWLLIVFTGAGILLVTVLLIILLLATRLPRRKPVPDLKISDVTPVSKTEPLVPVPPLVPREEIGLVLADVEKNKAHEAQRLIYMSTLKAAAYRGVDIRDSMTHREFERAASKAIPEVSTPLSRIIGSYEKAAYSPFTFDQAEAYASLELLKEVFAILRIEAS